MRIIELIKREKPFVSLEFFPPKEKARWPDFFRSVEKLRAIEPLFVSVTYGAGGSTHEFTLEIVSRLKEEFRLETMAHLTCIGASEDRLDSFLKDLTAEGADNVLALRGDPPEDKRVFEPDNEKFTYASNLVAFIRARFQHMGMGVAAYPEGHPDAPSKEDDLAFLKSKLDQGADFAITQLFFDNNIYRDFIRRARVAGIDKPIVPGVLPVLSLKSLERITGLCGATIPETYREKLFRANEEDGTEGVRALGIEYATKQARELLNGGAPGVHLYTMNKAEACIEIVRGLGV